MLMSVRLSVCLSGEKCSRAHNNHLSVSGQSKVSLRLSLGLFWVSLCLHCQTDRA